MKIGIIGGKLQGTEAVLLAQEAGMETLLIDWNEHCPASGLADVFLCEDVTAESDRLVSALKSCDLILPAMENDAVLAALLEITAREGIPCAFDFQAYEMTKSKLRSDRFFRECGVPVPEYYPAGNAPYILKPSGESGSAGVQFLADAAACEAALASKEDPENWIVQEYLNGPSYSIEVIGTPGHYRTYAVTQIHMDPVFDCCKVTTPCPDLPEELHQTFSDIAVTLAEGLKLRGIMDVEVIHDRGRLAVLEIDARLPSQTPLAILFSTGVNLLTELCDVTLKRQRPRAAETCRWTAYEHYRREGEHIVQEGEHMMSEARPLGRYGGPGELAVLDRPLTEDGFRGIFITSAESPEELEAKRNALKEHIWKAIH